MNTCTLISYASEGWTTAHAQMRVTIQKTFRNRKTAVEEGGDVHEAMPTAANDYGRYVSRRAHPSIEPLEATAEIRISAGTTKAIILRNQTLVLTCLWIRCNTLSCLLITVYY